MMKILPKICIGMPVFNGARYIRDALDSLLSQSYTDFELVISDNASTDDTQAICEAYAKLDQRIRYIRQSENIGVMSNFKFLLERARTDLFMWAASDDRWHHQFVASCVDVLDANENCISVFSNYKGIYLETGVTTESIAPKASISEKSLWRVLALIYHPSPNFIYGIHRTAKLQAIGVGNFDWYDVYLSIALALEGKIFVIQRTLMMAGAKSSSGGGGYSITGDRICLIGYQAATIRLVSDNFEGIERLLLVAVVKLATFKAQLSFWKRGI